MCPIGHQTDVFRSGLEQLQLPSAVIASEAGVDPIEFVVTVSEPLVRSVHPIGTASFVVGPRRRLDFLLRSYDLCSAVLSS
jgi:hypothetical protein